MFISYFDNIHPNNMPPQKSTELLTSHFPQVHFKFHENLSNILVFTLSHKPRFQLDLKLLTPHDERPILLEHPIQPLLIVHYLGRGEVPGHVLHLVSHLPDES